MGGGHLPLATADPFHIHYLAVVQAHHKSSQPGSSPEPPAESYPPGQAAAPFCWCDATQCAIPSPFTASDQSVDREALPGIVSSIYLTCVVCSGTSGRRVGPGNPIPISAYALPRCPVSCFKLYHTKVDPLITFIAQIFTSHSYLSVSPHTSTC